MDDLYAVVRAIAERVNIESLDPAQIYLGERYADSREDWAVKLQIDGAPFHWVAYSFGDIPMWMLHAGIVVDEHALNVGIHCHKDSDPEHIRVVHEVGAGFGKFQDSERARELQYNKMFSGYTKRDYEPVAAQLAKVYVAARKLLKQRALV